MAASAAVFFPFLCTFTRFTLTLFAIPGYECMKVCGRWLNIFGIERVVYVSVMCTCSMLTVRILLLFFFFLLLHSTKFSNPYVDAESTLLFLFLLHYLQSISRTILLYSQRVYARRRLYSTNISHIFFRYASVLV